MEWGSISLVCQEFLVPGIGPVGAAGVRPGTRTTTAAESLLCCCRRSGRLPWRGPDRRLRCGGPQSVKLLIVPPDDRERPVPDIVNVERRPQKAARVDIPLHGDGAHMV